MKRNPFRLHSVHLFLLLQYEELVSKVHAQVCEALQKLYDDHKAEYGWADRPLIIN